MSTKGKNKTLKPEELIQEWNEWESLPQIPELDENEVEKMDYRSEFQTILSEIQKTKKELTKDQYTNVLIFQSRFVLLLYQKNIDIPKLVLDLHDLRDMCIWKENAQRIIAILNSISSFFPNIEAKQNNKPEIRNKNYQNETPKIETKNNINTDQNRDYQQRLSKIEVNNNIRTDQNKDYQKSLPKIEANNTISTDQNKSYQNNLPKIEENNNINNKQPFSIERILNSNNISNTTHSENESNSAFSNKKLATTFYINKPNTNFSAQKKPVTNTQISINPFEILSTNNNLYEYESETKQQTLDQYDFENISIEDELDKLLHKLLDINNGIIDVSKTRDISNIINRIYRSNTNNPRWREENEYFQKRKVIPLEHIVKLRNFICNEEFRD